MNGFSVVEHNGIRLIRVDCICRSGIYQAYFSTGYGGVSSRLPYQCTMNLSPFKKCQNDTPENVHENFRLFADACGFPLEQISIRREEHGNRIERINRNTLYPYSADRGNCPSADGQVTTDPAVALFVYAADCVPVMIVDPVHEVSGIAHCGWRNSINGTIPNLIRSFREAGGSLPDAVVALGPSISARHFTAGSSTAEQFLAAGFSGQVSADPEKEDRWHIDLRSVDSILLQREGLREDQIHTAPWCTFENDLRLPSYERDRTLNGSIGGILFHNCLRKPAVV